MVARCVRDLMGRWRDWLAAQTGGREGDEMGE